VELVVLVAVVQLSETRVTPAVQVHLGKDFREGPLLVAALHILMVAVVEVAQLVVIQH
jgi:hypothetical protein